MKIYIAPGAPSDGAAYLEEILTAFGLNCIERSAAGQIFQKANPTHDLVIIPKGADTDGMQNFLRAGGRAIVIQPDRAVERIAGLTRKSNSSALSRLRFVTTLCPAARGEPLWTHGEISQYELTESATAFAYLSLPGDPQSDAYGIVELPVENGRLTVYAYDPVFCIARLRQGYPERANQLPGTQRTPRSVFLQQPGAPTDTYWRPTADLHAMAFCETVRRALAQHAPLPELWHLPDGRPSILLFSGDEDNCPQDGNDQQMRDVESFGGAMNLYVIPDLTSITPEHIKHYTQRGHAVSVHPNMVPTAGQEPAAQLAAAESQLMLFQERFDCPMRTVRNHFYMWPGYLELPELWQKFGIGMDANSCATLHYDSLEYGPYLNVHAAMPLRFVREDGSLIDVYQQPTHINDDLAVHPTKFYSVKYTTEQFEQVARRIIDDAMNYFHGPVCANVHPGNYVDFARLPGKALLNAAVEAGLAIWSLDRWHDFWRARATWRTDIQKWDGTSMQVRMYGGACDGLTVLLPAIHQGRACTQIKLNGVKMEATSLRRNGRTLLQIVLPPQATDVTLTVRYAGTTEAV